LPKCKHDDPVWFQRYLREVRWREQVAVMEREGLSVEDAAERFGVNERTIWRIKERARSGGGWKLS
jgi:transposase